MRTLPISRLLVAAAATVWLAGAAGAAQACGCELTREQVRAELAEARADGRLDGAGEAGPTEAVLAARERYNATEARVIAARLALEQEIQARADGGALLPDLASYVERGRDGPHLVLLIFDPHGRLHSSDTLAIAASD